MSHTFCIVHSPPFQEQQRGAHKLAEPDVRAKLDDKRGPAAVGLIWSTRFVLLCAEMINLVRGARRSREVQVHSQGRVLPFPVGYGGALRNPSAASWTDLHQTEQT